MDGQVVRATKVLTVIKYRVPKESDSTRLQKHPKVSQLLYHIHYIVKCNVM